MKISIMSLTEALAYYNKFNKLISIANHPSDGHKDYSVRVPNTYVGERLDLEFGDYEFQVKESERLPQQIHLEKVKEFYDQKLVDGDDVLIHCYAGVSRSAAIGLYILLLENDGDMDKSLKRMYEIRSITSPNRRLLEYIDVEFKFDGKLVDEVNRKDAEWIIR